MAKENQAAPAAQSQATTQEGANATLEFAQNLDLPAEVSAILLPKIGTGEQPPAKGRAIPADEEESASAETEEEEETSTEEETTEEEETSEEQETAEEEETSEEETTEEEEEETEEEESSEEEPEATPRTVKAFKKRIGEVTKARRDAEERAEAFRIENESLRARLGSDGRPVPTPNSPLADVADEASLNIRVQQAQVVKTWASTHLDGGSMPDGKGGELEFTAEQVREMLANADAVILVHAPQRAAYLQVNKAAEEQALKRFPDLAKPDSVDAKLADAIYREAPELKRFPNHKLLVGYLVSAMKSEKADAAAAKAKGKGKGKKEAKTVTTVFKPKGDAPIAPGAPIRSAAAPRKPVEDKSRTEKAKLKQVAESGGSVDSLTAAFM